MRTIHVISVSDSREKYRAYAVENPSVYYTSTVSAMDAVGSLLRINNEFFANIEVLDLDNLESR
jgi:hypothetical protein